MYDFLAKKMIVYKITHSLQCKFYNGNGDKQPYSSKLPIYDLHCVKIQCKAFSIYTKYYLFKCTCIWL